MQFAISYIKSAGIPSGSLPNPINQDNELQTPTPTDITAALDITTVIDITTAPDITYCILQRTNWTYSNPIICLNLV